jgi:hypothetical protein
MGGEKLSIKKTIPLLLAALVMVAGVSIIVMKLGLCMWVVWLGMVAWCMAGGMKAEIGEVSKCWGCGAFGVFMGYMLTQGVGGTAGITIAFVILLLFIFGMVSGRWKTFPCNNYTAVFLTVTTAQGILLDPKQLVLSFLFGYAVFGLIPVAFSAMGKKKNKAQKA